MNTFEDLEAWKAARIFRCSISRMIKILPKSEQYILSNQIIRSSRSVAANIAEGFGRFHYQENIQFCRQARGSLTETMEHIICAFDEHYIDEITYSDLRAQYSSCLKILNGYIAYLRKAKEADSTAIT